MGDDHVAVGAGLLVEADAAPDIERLGHVNLDVVDEVAAPDRLEQAVGESEGENVLRRLLAEEMVDPEDLLLGKNLVQLGVERHRALEIGAERFFHDDARTLGESRFVEHPHRRQRRARRHAGVVDELVGLAERGGGLLDRVLQGARALRQRHIVERRREDGPGAVDRLVRMMPLDRLMGELAKGVRVDVVERHADDAALRDEAGCGEMKEAGQQLALRQIPGRAEQDDDLRHPWTDPWRYLRHRASPFAPSGRPASLPEST